MKKYLPIVASVLLGLLFLMGSITFFLGKVPEEKVIEGSPKAMFGGAFGPTGYMAFVKVFELAGGVLVMIPRLRNLGLLLLGPVIVNIVAYNTFIEKISLLNPLNLILVALPLYLLWDARRKFAGLLN